LLDFSLQKPHEYRGFSLPCVFLRPPAKPLAGILSPQRLPFRHPGDWLYKSNQEMWFLQPRQHGTERRRRDVSCTMAGAYSIAKAIA
jgi:hypothetical protein